MSDVYLLIHPDILSKSSGGKYTILLIVHDTARYNLYITRLIFKIKLKSTALYLIWNYSYFIVKCWSVEFFFIANLGCCHDRDNKVIYIYPIKWPPK
jgi:hypothetical protein